MEIPALPTSKRKETITKRQKMQRELLFVELRKNSVMTVACQKAGIPRSTVYRWMNDDPEFMNLIEQAVSEGRETINDMAESVVIKKVREENLNAAKYWLSHNKSQYRALGYRNFDSNARQELQRIKDTFKKLFSGHFRKKKKK